MSDTVYVEHLKALPIKDGDMLVFKYPKVLSDDAKRNIVRGLRETVNDLGFKNVKVLILEEGADLGVITKGEADADPTTQTMRLH